MNALSALAWYQRYAISVERTRPQDRKAHISCVPTSGHLPVFIPRMTSQLVCAVSAMARATRAVFLHRGRLVVRAKIDWATHTAQPRSTMMQRISIGPTPASVSRTGNSPRGPVPEATKRSDGLHLSKSVDVLKRNSFATDFYKVILL